MPETTQTSATPPATSGGITAEQLSAAISQSVSDAMKPLNDQITALSENQRIMASTMAADAAKAAAAAPAPAAAPAAAPATAAPAVAAAPAPAAAAPAPAATSFGGGGGGTPVTAAPAAGSRFPNLKPGTAKFAESIKLPE